MTGVQVEAARADHVAMRTHATGPLPSDPLDATVDHLTGTATASVTRRWLAARAADHGTRAAIHFDIDDLGSLNSRHGRAVGDWVLGVVGARLNASIPDHAIAARTGGDDFVVLVDDAEDTDLDALIDELRQALESPIGDLTLSFSFGLSVARSGNEGAGLVDDAVRATRLQRTRRALD